MDKAKLTADKETLEEVLTIFECESNESCISAMETAITLIDREIARLDSTDSTRVSEDVQAAIDRLEKIYSDIKQGYGLASYEADKDHAALRLAITALRQMKGE